MRSQPPASLMQRAARSVKSVATVAYTLAGAGINSVWSRLGGLGFGSRLRFLLPGARYDYEREAGDLWSNSVVAICLKWAGDNYPKPKLRVNRVLRNGELDTVANHALCQLMRRPNPHYTGRTLSKALVLSLLADGNGYVIKIRNSFKQVIGLYWVPHWLMQPVWPADGSTYIAAYQYLLDYQLCEIATEDVIHFRDGIDPRNDRLGLSALKAQCREICTDNEVSGYTASIMRNSGVPGLVVIPKDPKGKFTQTQADLVKAKVSDSLTGEKRGEPAIFSEQVEIKELGFSPEKLRLEKLPARSEARICASMGLSPMVVGLPDPNKTYSNYKEATTAAWRQCLVPLGDLVSETLHWELLREFEDPAKFLLDYDYNQVEALQEDLQTKHDRVRADWQAGLVTHGEATSILGYEQDPESDDRYFPGTGSPDDPATQQQHLAVQRALEPPDDDDADADGKPKDPADPADPADPEGAGSDGPSDDGTAKEPGAKSADRLAHMKGIKWSY